MPPLQTPGLPFKYWLTIPPAQFMSQLSEGWKILIWPISSSFTPPPTAISNQDWFNLWNQYRNMSFSWSLCAIKHFNDEWVCPTAWVFFSAAGLFIIFCAAAHCMSLAWFGLGSGSSLHTNQRGARQSGFQRWRCWRVLCAMRCCTCLFMCGCVCGTATDEARSWQGDSGGDSAFSSSCVCCVPLSWVTLQTHH